MSSFRFDGRVAIVTGAGRGLGRAHAHLLATRGARVVVNDLGGTMQGDGADASVAAAVVDEISAGGGEAIADEHDISTEAGARALIDTAVERFGRLDVLVNNAGIIQWAGMPDVDAAAVEQHLAVHTLGSFHTARAAWPHLAAQGAGRIVNTTSAGVFGLAGNLSYATAKGGVIGLTRSLAVEGAASGIKVNAVAPAAVTRMGGDDASAAVMQPAQVAPLVAWLAHVDCPVTGEIYTAGAGRFARVFIGVTDGYLADQTAPTIEDVAAHWESINDATSFSVPADLSAWSASFLSHLWKPRS